MSHYMFIDTVQLTTISRKCNASAQLDININKSDENTFTLIIEYDFCYPAKVIFIQYLVVCKR